MRERPLPTQATAAKAPSSGRRARDDPRPDPALTRPLRPRSFGRENIHIPMATGVGEWDMVGGCCGEGGKGNALELTDGNCGAIIIYRPGFFDENPL